jgi:integrase
MKKKQPKTWVTKEEYNRIINNPYLPRKDDLIIQLLYSCAFRVGELVNIKVKDVYKKSHYLYMGIKEIK